jgi:transcriptional regulator with XRE-family HTH domain
MSLDKKAVAERLRQHLEKKYKTIEKAAEALHWSAKSLRSNYLSGNSLPGPEFISDLMNDGCDIDWLLHGKEKKPENLDKDISRIYDSLSKEVRKDYQESKVSKLLKSAIENSDKEDLKPSNQNFPSISNEELLIIMKLRAIPEAFEIIDNILNGLILTKEGINKLNKLNLDSLSRNSLDTSTSSE